MHVLHLQCPAEEKDLLVAELYSRGTAGIIEGDEADGRVNLEAFYQERFPTGEWVAYEPRWTPADETNWVRVIMENWEPVAVGERFFLAPDWRAEPTPAGRIRLEVRPGLALGTGYHPTTQMCLEAMERNLRAEDRFLDLGAGSGILSHAAWLLGVRAIIAADIDPQAIESARENLERYGVAARLISGSAELLEDDCADVAAANISAEGLLELAPEIERCLAPEGVAILSGFAPERSAEVRLRYEQAGFLRLEGTGEGEWASLVLRRQRTAWAHPGVTAP